MTYIIGECGLSHNGSLATAKKMVDALIECGADCAKFQMYNSDTLCSYFYQPELYKKFTECELTNWQMVELSEYCKTVGIDFMCTPEGIPEAVFLNAIVDKWKISSVGACNPHLLKMINTFGKPVYISNGLANDDAIDIADELLKDCEVTWLSCVCAYPAGKWEYLWMASGIGLSDHTTGLNLPVTWNPTVIEKHFTLDKTQDGFDHHMSLDPVEMKEYIRRIRGGKNA